MPARRAQAYARALRALASEREAATDPGGAALWWRRLAAHEPHDSRTTIRLLRALEAGGDIGGALRAGLAHEAMLRDDLELGPPEELVEEMDRLRREHPGRATELSAPSAPPTQEPLENRPAASPAAEAQVPRQPRVRRRHLVGIAVLGGLILALVVGMLVRDRPTSGSAPVRPVVAVLPFQSMSGGEEHAYFADALTDAIITDLARLPGLAVISRSSVEPYRVIDR